MQYSLSRLITDLKQIENQDSNIEFDFGKSPTTIVSWRWDYSMPAILWGIEHATMGWMKVSEFLKMCEDTVGKTLIGYKGWEFIMDKFDRLWVCEASNYSGNLGICGVSDLGWRVILNTEWCEY